MLVDYAVTEIGYFVDYLGAVPGVRTMRGNSIATFTFHVAQCITFNNNNTFIATLIAEASLNSLYSRLGFKGI